MRRVLLHLLQIALLDLLHHGFAAKQIFFELHRNLRGRREIGFESFENETGPRAGIRCVPH